MTFLLLCCSNDKFQHCLGNCIAITACSYHWRKHIIILINSISRLLKGKDRNFSQVNLSHKYRAMELQRKSDWMERILFNIQYFNCTKTQQAGSYLSPILLLLLKTVMTNNTYSLQKVLAIFGSLNLSVMHPIKLKVQSLNQAGQCHVLKKLIWKLNFVLQRYLW